MSRAKMQVREACANDSKELCSILNEIIEVGGTTGYEIKLSESEFEFESCFLTGENYIGCFLAENDKMILGFQSLPNHPDLFGSWADIATFTRMTSKIGGVGTSLFKKTLKFSRKQNISTLNATTRADNKSGLSYYNKMGFTDYSVAMGIPLQNGTLVDRISKKYIVTL